MPVWFRQRIPDRFWQPVQISFRGNERHSHMGIKDAYIGALIVVPVAFVPGLYASCCPAWRAQWQVSGHLASETKRCSLSPRLNSQHQENSPKSFSPTLPGSKRALCRLRGTMLCSPEIPLAGSFPVCVPKRTGHRNVWRSDYNARGWMSAGICSPALSWALPKPALIFYSVFKRFFACPSSDFSQNRFKTRTRCMPSVSPTNRPLPQRNPGEQTLVANAKS